MIRLLDISNIQGEIPWDALKAEGVEGVYIRCGVGNDPKDSRFEKYAAEAKAHGIKAAPYHFLYPLPHIDPVHQAEVHFAQSGGLGSNVGDSAAAGDVEWPSRETRLPDGSLEDTWKKWGCTRTQILSWLKAYFARYHELQGRPMVLYTYPYYWTCLSPIPDDVAAVLSECILWWASERSGGVPKDGDMPSNKIPQLWQKDILGDGRGFLWQHDGNGGLKMPNGVDADFDVAVMSREQWAQFTRDADNTIHDDVQVPITEHLPDTDSGGDGSGSA